ncbi:MAG TPA: hypothetical protein VFC63_15840 [Blastocatellia bacterium]|nr:hypothetical protein [Blastocatellia bacterium]
MIRSRSWLFLAVILLVLFSCVVVSPQNAPVDTDTHFHYKFANPRFLISNMEIDFDGTGQGTMKFTEQDHDDVENKFSLKASTIADFIALFDQLAFLKTKEVYQTPKDFSYLGVATIRYRRGSDEREVTFSYTENKTMKDLWDKFRSVENQEYGLFKLELAVHYQPLDTPAQLKAIDNMLKDKKIAEPDRFLPILRQISTNDQIMTIARGQAKKMIDFIESGKK